MNYCKCNCGEIVRNDWAVGHHRRGTTFKHTEEAREKCRLAKLGNKNPRFGKVGTCVGRKHTGEQIKKIKEARAKQVFTSEERERARVGVINAWKKSVRYKGGEATKKQRRVISQRNREARKKANGGQFTLLEWEVLKSRFNNMCLCCKRTEPEIKLTVDHIIPISKGGRNDIQNIQPLCFSCNARKNAKHIDFISLYELRFIGTQS